MAAVRHFGIVVTSVMTICV